MSRKQPNNYPALDLVRLCQLTLEEERNWRAIVRTTRLTYNSQLNRCIIKQKHKQEQKRHYRADMIVGTIMKDHGLWLHKEFYFVGSVPGVEIGDVFMYKIELSVVGLHNNPNSRIGFTQPNQRSMRELIATSIVISNEDNDDQGEVINYKGQEVENMYGRQDADRNLTGNLALKRSMYHGVEVRVIRKIKYKGSVSKSVYVYDGLYRVVDCGHDEHQSGLHIFKFTLVRIEGQREMGSVVINFAKAIIIDPKKSRPMGHFVFDISNRKEMVPVHFYNNVDGEKNPTLFEYLQRTKFSPFAHLNDGVLVGCDCEGGCVEDCQCAMRNGGEFPYSDKGMLLMGKPLIFECGLNCRCPPKCKNRVSQRGLKYRLEIVKTNVNSWGVRSLDLIPARSFICEYVGTALTRDEAFFLSMNGGKFIYPRNFTNWWAEWGDLSLIDSSYQRPSYPATPSLDFAIDVSTTRNVAFYMCHSDTPNVFFQFVLYDHNNPSFPRVMLFALENIPPLRYLSIDRGVEANESAGILHPLS